MNFSLPHPTALSPHQGREPHILSACPSLQEPDLATLDTTGVACDSQICSHVL